MTAHSATTCKPLYLATYNIHRCIGTDGRHDPDRVAAVIKELDADIIGLQEVDARYHVEDGLDQADYLSRSLGLTVVEGPTLRRHSGRYGNALLTKHPIVHVDRVDLSVDGREPRGALSVSVDCRGSILQLIVAHFGLRRPERDLQTVRLLECIHPQPDHVLVLLGDFNEWRRWRTARSLDAHFGPNPALLTFPSWRPIFPLDRIWTRPAHALLELRVHRSRLARKASDHLPLLATILPHSEMVAQHRENGNAVKANRARASA